MTTNSRGRTALTPAQAATARTMLQGVRTNVTQEHLDWVDRARGVGIILVVFGHVADGVYRAGIAFPPATFRLLYDTIYSFHMPLFFLLAGLFFLPSWTRRGTALLIRSKLDTILYPYILWSLVQGSIEVAASQYTNQQTSMISVLSLLWNPRQQFWFLYVLFIEFLLGCLVCALLPRRWHFVVVILAATAFVFRSSGPHVGPPYYLAAESVFFFCGLLLGERLQSPKPPATVTLMLTAAGFVLAQTAAARYRSGLPSPLQGLMDLAVALVSIAFVITFSKVPMGALTRWLALLGQQSLAIYLLHTIFASSTRIVLMKFMGIYRLDAHLIVGLAVGLLIPLLCARLVQRFHIEGVFSMPAKWRLAAGSATARASVS
jgi:fucose 4-O-acetylase-like acetyltransferase